MKKEGLFLILAFAILGLLTTYSNCGMHLRPQDGGNQSGLPTTPGSGDGNFTVGGQAVVPINQKIDVDINGQIFTVENGTFVGPQPFPTDTTYEVTVVSGPGGAYTCAVQNGTGTIDNQNVTNVTIECICQVGDEGAGSQINPYKIFTAQQLNTIAVNQNNTTYMGTASNRVYYKQMCDLDYENITPTPLGSLSDAPFIGEYDGQGFAIVNYTSQNNDPTRSVRKGLFVRAHNAKIHNLQLIGWILKANNNMAGSEMGAIAARATNSEIKNIRAQDIQVDDMGIALARAGGLIGYNAYSGAGSASTAKEVSNIQLQDVEINASESNYVGALMGKNERPLSKILVSNATVYCKTYCGTIAGWMHYYTMHDIGVSESFVEGRSTVGGLVGELSQSFSGSTGFFPGINRSYFEGIVRATTSTGRAGGWVGSTATNTVLTHGFVVADIFSVSSNNIGYVSGTAANASNLSHLSGKTCQNCNNAVGSVVEAQIENYFSGTNNAMNTWDFSNVWKLHNQTLPSLR